MSMMNPVIVLCGPTGVGKSFLAVKLAKRVGGEIISADSMQVYRGMDVGTAKASRLEREEVPHHLIDICDVKDSFNVVDFCLQAHLAIESVLLRDKVPIVVGGSGFYIHGLLYGAPKGPRSDSKIRDQLESELEKEGVQWLYARLQGLDPLYAQTIMMHDKHKIVRALEVIAITGKPVSDFKQSDVSDSHLFQCWFLNRPREILYRRINERCETMLQEGLIEEVIALEKQGLRQNSSASQSIGYRQVLEYLSTAQTPADYVQFKEKFKAASRHYAKRQLTWFKKEPLFRWIDLDVYDEKNLLDKLLN